MGDFVKGLAIKNQLFLIMRLTDDYIIFSDKKKNVQDIVKKLFICSEKNNFRFNRKKLRANFELPGFLRESDEK